MTIGGVKSKETRSYQKGKCNGPIFSTCRNNACNKCAKYRTITFSLLIRPCLLAFYTTILSSNPIYHQLSRRECFYLLVYSERVFTSTSNQNLRYILMHGQ